MNAITTTKKMAEQLINAGFDVKIEETETSFSFNAMSKNDVFDTTYMFFATAKLTDGNRTRKHFSVVKSYVFSKTESKRNLTYREMSNEIDWAIRMSKKAA